MELKKDLPSRTTRGKRLSTLLDKEAMEADEAFWGQEFFQEEVCDKDYSSESGNI